MILCHKMASEYGKWPHEVMMGRNDEPGYIDFSLLIFDIQCLEIYTQAVAEAEKKAAARRRR